MSWKHPLRSHVPDKPSAVCRCMASSTRSPLKNAAAFHPKLAGAVTVCSKVTMVKKEGALAPAPASQLAFHSQTHAYSQANQDTR